MRKNRIRQAAAILMCLVMLLSICGCGMFASLDLTEEESGLIAEYAAGLLKKYDRNATRLMNPDAVAEPEDTQKPEEELPEEPAPEATPEETSDATSAEELSFEDLSAQESAEDLGVEDLSSEESVYSAESIASCLGLENIDVNYRGYEICDTYPEQPDNSWLISMSAVEGKKLVVVRFEIANNGSGEVSCDILNAGKQYRLIVNGDKRINETVTVLMDSFSQYNGTLASGDSEEAVLIFELDNDLVEQVKNLDLVIKDSEGSETFRLE